MKTDDTKAPAELETPRLILRKSRFEDWRDMYENVWSRPESARYMLWSVTTNEDDARARMERTLKFEQTHPWKYAVEEKASGKVIGWAGIERLGEGVWGETGIALGPDFFCRGYGREIVERLTALCRDELGAREFVYSAREGNVASIALAHACGFSFERSEVRTEDEGNEYTLNYYRKKLK